jgi:RNA exonuclease 4
MVEINRLHNGLARVTVINEEGELIIDTFCKPTNNLNDITDYRTDITGITFSDLENAMDYEKCRKTILKLFKGKILIGHGLDNDFDVLNYQHPKNLIRDTSKYKFFQTNINQPFSLKYLSEKYLGKEIQTNIHDSIEDSRAVLGLYKLYEEEIEKDVVNKNHKLARKKVIEDAKKLKSLFGEITK